MAAGKPLVAAVDEGREGDRQTAMPRMHIIAGAFFLLEARFLFSLYRQMVYNVVYCEQRCMGGLYATSGWIPEKENGSGSDWRRCWDRYIGWQWSDGGG
jgi:hypothetical protein